MLGQMPAAVMFMVIARSRATLLPRIGVRHLLLAGSVEALTLIVASTANVPEGDAGIVGGLAIAAASLLLPRHRRG